MAAEQALQAWLDALSPDERAAREADLERLVQGLAALVASTYRQKVGQQAQAPRPPTVPGGRGGGRGGSR